MNITEVRIRLINKDEGKLKAVATLTVDDCFAIHDIKVIENDGQYYIAMPSKKIPTGEYRDIVHPLNNETRDSLKKLIIDEYLKAMQGTEAV